MTQPNEHPDADETRAGERQADFKPVVLDYQAADPYGDPWAGLSDDGGPLKPGDTEPATEAP